MPKLVSAITALVVGYLGGAGLGAELYGFVSDRELTIVLVAALAAGPLGALLGLLFARTPSRAEPAKSAE